LPAGSIKVSTVHEALTREQRSRKFAIAWWYVVTVSLERISAAAGKNAPVQAERWMREREAERCECAD
jgi:hypothetical protein